jgi:hypothetical protein
LFIVQFFILCKIVHLQPNFLKGTFGEVHFKQHHPIWSDEAVGPENHKPYQNMYAMDSQKVEVWGLIKAYKDGWSHIQTGLSAWRHSGSKSARIMGHAAL